MAIFRGKTRRETRDSGRLEAFSDGVFSVAITLLVLNIKLPDAASIAQGNSGIWSFIGSQWLVFSAFLISFATIGIMWINHHRIFTHIKRTDNTLLILNLLLLLVIVFIPYPTELLAQSPIKPGLYAPAVVYDATFLLMAILFNVIWRYASYNNRLLDEHVDQKAVWSISAQYLFGPLFYAITLGLAWVSVPISIAMSAVLAIFFMLPGKQLPDDEDATIRNSISKDNVVELEK